VLNRFYRNVHVPFARNNALPACHNFAISDTVLQPRVPLLQMTIHIFILCAKTMLPLKTFSPYVKVFRFSICFCFVLFYFIFCIRQACISITVRLSRTTCCWQTLLIKKITVFCVVAPCSLVDVYLRFGGSCCLHHQGDGSDYGGKTQKTAIFILAAVRTSNHTLTKKFNWTVVAVVNALLEKNR
jgi:hypothetical protein